MVNFKMEIEYDGSNYHGWQRQQKCITIQEIIEDSIYKITNNKISLVASGRTDAGVHARGQVVNFKSETEIPPFAIKRALNSLLPDDIVVKEIIEVSDNFNARFSAVSKCYQYTILNREFPSAMMYKYSWYIPKILDIKKMSSASELLIGENDYASFMGAKSNTKSSVRKITKLNMYKDGDIINIVFEGNGFLKYMVRNIVGTLVEIGKERLSPSSLKCILEARDRRKAGPTAPARGLCLLNVKYN